jgi:quercetin dioxygenase-like cupin family protein
MFGKFGSALMNGRRGQWRPLPGARGRDEDLGGGVTRKVLAHDGGLMQVEVAFQEGAVGALHSHPHEQIVMMIEGKLRLTVGDVDKTIVSGDIVVIPPGVSHEAQALEDTVVLDIFSPPRPEYRKPGKGFGTG